jgi:tRNA A58 N-methylase Trm61
LSRDYFLKSIEEESISGEKVQKKYIKPMDMMQGHTGFLTFARKTK